jgi:hypothetical protein
MIIAKIEIFPLRIPFKSNTRAAASAWGDKDLPVADSLLVKVTFHDRCDVEDRFGYFVGQVGC